MGIEAKFSRLIEKLRYGEKATSESYISYLKSIGVSIGDNTTIFHTPTVTIDATRPELLTIGSQVKITKGCTILTHGYDWSVLNGAYGDIMGSAGKVVIGNNVFIGMNSTILKGVHIGNNVIIGAGSVVSKDIPDNCVAVGNPAKVIYTIEEYREKRKKAQLTEAVELANAYKDRFHKNPPQKTFDEFFWLFEKRTSEQLAEPAFEEKMHLNGNYEKALASYLKTEQLFESYEAFLEYCYREGNKE